MFTGFPKYLLQFNEVEEHAECRKELMTKVDEWQKAERDKLKSTMAELETIKVDMQLANVIVASFKATLKDQAAKMETVKEEMQTVLGREAEVMADYR